MSRRAPNSVLIPSGRCRPQRRARSLLTPWRSPPLVAGRLTESDAGRRHDRDAAASRPGEADGGHLLGALMTSITLGLVIVFSLSSSSAVDTTKNTLSPAADIALGAIALIGAVDPLVQTPQTPRASCQRQEKKSKPNKPPPRWQQELRKGSPRTTSSSGRYSRCQAPHTSPACSQIHKLHYSTTATVLLVVGFNLIMLWLIEVPLACFPGRPALDAPRDRSSESPGSAATRTRSRSEG